MDDRGSPGSFSIWRGSVVTLSLIGMGLGAWLGPPLPAQPPPAVDRNPSIDTLLGRNGRATLAASLRTRVLNGWVYPWEYYSAWGGELVTAGFVRKPPIGTAPSAPLSQHYRCVQCHNLGREDEQLTVQDPTTRERWFRAANYPQPEKRDGQVFFLATGTTLWGAVNRERFYNGHYQNYHFLKLADGSRMNPEKLADAVQICCRNCSGGRFAEPWELDSILAYLWDLELRWQDLRLPDETQRKMLAQLASPDPRAREDARTVIRSSYLRAAGADRIDLPLRSEENRDIYGDGSVETGDAQAGKFLYASACAGCHGSDTILLSGAQLLLSDKRFHRYVWHGTERDGAYMPLFTKQRLSRRQAADIRAYLKSLK
jgi:mono/diheme cytochrome c family protein